MQALLELHALTQVVHSLGRWYSIVYPPSLPPPSGEVVWYCVPPPPGEVVWYCVHRLLLGKLLVVCFLKQVKTILNYLYPENPN